MSRRTGGSLVIFGLAVSWGIISILVREIDLPALALVFWRVALAAVAIALLLGLAGRGGSLLPPRRANLALGALLGLHWACYFGAIRETSVASANLLTYASPIFVAALAPMMLGERAGAATLGALGAGVAGIAVIAILGPTSGDAAVRPLGVALGAGAAVTYALMILLLKRSGVAADPVRTVFWQSLAAAVLLAPFAAVADYGGLDARQWAYVVLLGVVLTGLSGLIFVAALHLVPATTASILAYMEPVSAALLAAALLGEQLTPAVAAGGALILAAGVVVIVGTPSERDAVPGSFPVGDGQPVSSTEWAGR
jgi:drug/metabolite transporter, DME family